jgi:hypothetical protein
VKKSIFAIVALIATSAFAASDTGTLTLTGIVNVRYEISLDNTSATVDILNGENKKLVATATETSNNLLGYKIQMSSVNGSKLVNSSDSTVSTDYKVYYGSNPVPWTLTSAPQTVRSVSSLTGLTNTPSEIKVDVTAMPTAPAGSYSDTITIKISAP